jgi:hypothetical protein
MCLTTLTLARRRSSSSCRRVYIQVYVIYRPSSFSSFHSTFVPCVTGAGLRVLFASSSSFTIVFPLVLIMLRLVMIGAASSVAAAVQPLSNVLAGQVPLQACEPWQHSVAQSISEFVNDVNPSRVADTAAAPSGFVPVYKNKNARSTGTGMPQPLFPSPRY